MKILLRVVIVLALTAIGVVVFVWLSVSRITSGVVDNGEHMGRVLRDGARELRRSGEPELVIEYRPINGVQQEYTVTLKASSNPTGAPLPGKSHRSYGTEYLSVSSEELGGSTTHHQIWVRVTKDFTIHKTNKATFITLRKNGEHIDVMEVR